jgi:hypothetical protein
MPYTITTTRLDLKLHGEYASRLAVATLEEARQAVANETLLHGYEALPEHEAEKFDRQYMLLRQNGGGTVGPLPDGTVIEVKQVGWFDVAERVRGKRLVPAGRAAQAELIAAFNAREATR